MTRQVACHDEAMAEYGPESYGEAFADVYDDWYANVTDVATCTTALAGLAGGGRVHEPRVVM